MSSAKKIPVSHPAIPHFSKIDSGASPPKYQPPPRPPGILKPFPSRIRQQDRQIYRLEDDTKRRGGPAPDLRPRPAEIEIERKHNFPNPPKYPAPPPVTRGVGVTKPATAPATDAPERSKSADADPFHPQETVANRSEMLKFVRVNKQDSSETDKISLSEAAVERAREINDPDRQARRIASYANEIRALQEANQRLGDDNQELRDLCCFLDDDRQKGRKLAREWQRFGRYTASVMRQEVSAYQNKLRQLENKQQELIKDNLELKELCLYLDEERNQPGSCPSCGAGLSGARPGHRDDGDGSSSSTNADEPGVSSYPASSSERARHHSTARRSESRERLLEESIQRQRNVFNEQIIQYVKYLERRVKTLEGDRQVLVRQLLQNGIREDEIPVGPVWGSPAPEEDASGRPEAVVRALQVLEVRESIDKCNDEVNAGSANRSAELPLEMGDREKALVMEMCNVVWRKLEEGPAAR